MSAFYYNWFMMCRQNGTVTDAQLQTALDRGMLTQEEYMAITGYSTTTNETTEPPTT
jgi:hypothetical protein